MPKKYFFGREKVEDDEIPDRPVTIITDENADKVRTLLKNNHCLSIKTAAAEELNMDKEIVTQITTRNFNIRKVWDKMASKKLNEEQKLKINLC
jgi:hypothetical protein